MPAWQVWGPEFKPNYQKQKKNCGMFIKWLLTSKKKELVSHVTYNSIVQS
jgi:hypothetical protein